MNLTKDMYVPSLRWRQAEFQALFKLTEAAKKRLVPYITVTKPEYNFEERRPKRTPSEQVEPFPAKFVKKWGLRPAWIEVEAAIEVEKLTNGTIALVYIFEALRREGAVAVPALAMSAAPEVKSAVKEISTIDGRGVAVRLGFVDIMGAGRAARLQALLSELGVNLAQVDVVLDLVAESYEPYDDFAKSVVSACRALGNLEAYRSFVLLGSAFPDKAEISKPGGVLTRHDWKFYTSLRKHLHGLSRIPNYGDYTIIPPSFSAGIDFRMYKPSGKVVYTSGDSWLIRKGGAFAKNRLQMHEHCDHILSSGLFRGADFSEGDSYIEQCARHLVGPSSLTRWKEIGISHYIMHVLEDISKSAV